MRKWLLRLFQLGLGLVALGCAVIASSCAATGSSASGSRLERMKKSPQWKGEAFGNVLPRVDGEFGEMLGRFLSGNEQTTPALVPSVEGREANEFSTPPQSGLRVTWLGHSTLLLEIDGSRILIDPVWGERASPFTWMGPKRFYEPPLPLEELPQVDAVVISHDHYDHLDYPTVVRMLEIETKWVVPLGIGAHLEAWGMPAARIIELDWWEDTKIAGLTITCTPARHFSGRSVVMSDQNATLWAGWAVAGPRHRVFYSGDTALHPALADIGERLGPFDLTMMEAGAYDPLWSDVHLGPEQAIIAHQLVRGRVLLPVHWGMFDLANHAWTEPIHRILAAAKKTRVTVIAPRPGGSVEPAHGQFIDRWWSQDVRWKPMEQRPAWSTSVDELLQKSPLFSPTPR